MEKGKSALSKVLASLCIHHQQQVLAMLKFLVQEQNAASLCCYNTSFTVTSDSQKPLIEDNFSDLFCNCEYRLAERGYSQNERQSLDFVPLPVCIKDLHCFSCQTVTAEHIKTNVKRGIANSCNSHRCCSGLVPDIHSTKSAIHAPFLRSGVYDDSFSPNEVCRSRSPSPPPLSPVQAEGLEKRQDVTSELLALENNRLEPSINQPPSLIPAEISGGECKQGQVHKTTKSCTSDSLLSEGSNYSTNHENDESAVAFQDLMNRINEKLKSIEAIDTANHVKLPSSDYNADKDFKLRDLIASLSHNATASDCSFMELLRQHDTKVENKIIQTRFRKRQEALRATHSSLDSPTCRRQSLQIKRQLASFEEHFTRKKHTGKNSKKLMHGDKEFLVDKEFSHCQEPSLKYPKSLQDNSVETSFSPDHILHSQQLPHYNLETNLSFGAFSESFKTTSKKMGIEKSLEKSAAGKISLQNQRENKKLENIPTLFEGDIPGTVSRTKRNIVAPGWYSIYVTNNYNLKKSKAKHISEFTVKSATVKKTHTESSCHINLNKIAMSSNLQVVVERLEDTISMGQKSSYNHSSSQVYKTSKKLAEIDDKDQNPNRNRNFAVSKLACKEQNLSKSVSASSNLKSNPMHSIEFNNVRTDIMKKSSVLSNVSLVSEVESMPTKYGTKETSFSNYSSPVKLMFLSEVQNSEGIKYTLTSVSTSESNVDPHFKKRPAHHVTEKKEMNADILNANLENYRSHLSDALQRENNFNCTEITAESSMLIGKSDEKVQEEPKGNSSSAIDFSFKRKPGRPKKVGPPVVKHIKRPVGRPPKPKTEVKEGSITVTVIYGRSRTRRQVSEGRINKSKIMSLNNVEFSTKYNSCRSIREYKINSGERIGAISSLTSQCKILGSDFDDSGSTKNTSLIPQPSKKVIRPSQKPLAITRKPGRPAKFKISGISVTINQTSPQEREVILSSYLPPLQEAEMLGKNLPEENYDRQCHQVDGPRHTEAEILKNVSKSTVVSTPLRHSVRERKPSIHALHPLTLSGSLTSRKNLLPLHESKREKSQREKLRQSGIKTIPRNTRNKRKCLENNWLVPNSDISLDSIISSHPLLRWWATSTSNDYLLKELNNRFEQITDAWVHVSRDEAEHCFHRKREHTEDDHFKIANPLGTCLLELEASPVKMLFQKKCDLNELCTWFMQTTETQSLSLVRKANARNPVEIINSKEIKLGTRSSEFNMSPFKNYFKKFALSSPSRSAGKFHRLPKTVSSPLFDAKSNFTLARLKGTECKRLPHEGLRREGKVPKRGAVDWISKRRSLRFFCQNKLLSKAKKATKTGSSLQGEDASEQALVLPSEIQGNFLQQRVAVSHLKPHASSEGKVESQAKENGRKASGKGFERGPELGSTCPKNWRTNSLKDCKIFLRKINYLEHTNTFKLNTVLDAPDCPSSGGSHQTDVKKPEHLTLRSHFVRQNPLKRQFTDIKNGITSSSSDHKCPDQLGSSKPDKCANSDKSPSNSSETLSKLNKRKRPPWKTTEMPTKRPKRQSCNSEQMANYYSKSQLGKFFSP